MLNLHRTFRYTKDEYEFICSMTPHNGDMWKRHSNDMENLKNKIRKKMLRRQKNKCIFCHIELNFGCVSDIEHFAPKGKTRQNKILYPEFMFHHDNLYMSCHICNRSDKKTYDVIEKYNKVYKNNVFNVIHPLYDDVEKHIYLGKDNILKGITKKGKSTIDVFDLNNKLKKENRTRTEVMKLLSPSKLGNDKFNKIIEELRNGTLRI